MQAEKISLYYKDAGSDKEYHVHLEQQGDEFITYCLWGKRGSRLTRTDKKQGPYAACKKEYDSIVKKQKGKGYTEGESGTPFQGSEKAGELSGLVPQLLNIIDDENELQKFLQDDLFMMEEKKDGERLMTRVTGGKVEGSNRKGLYTSVQQPVVEFLKELGSGGDLVLDGEMVQGTYWVFDALEINGKDLRQSTAKDRYVWLRDLMEPYGLEGSPIQLVPACFSTDGKISHFNMLKELRAEGVVFKHIMSSYVPGRPNSGGNQRKFKFKASATCLVLKQNGVKRSVALGLMIGDGEGSSEHRNVGNVTILPNFEIPAPGTLVEVEYLYAYPGGSLYQPVYKGPRPDKDRADWDGTQKFKQGTTDEDDA